MTRSASTPTRPGRSTTRLLLYAVIALAVLGAGAGLWILFVRGTPPPPVGSAAASVAATQPAGESAPAGTTTPASQGTGSGATWTVDTSIGSFSDFSSSFVGYRVNETLAGNKANTAVGRTPSVGGSLTLDGRRITSVQITADLSQLRSDDDRRDGRLRDQAIETSRFPQATFTLTQPIDLGSVPADGASFDVTAVGDLTLHGVTKSVSIPLHAQLSGDVVTVTGSIEIVFADFSIEKPTSFLVLSIEDHGIMELQLHFRRG
jgi:polyisoprenoid-binding protein YceI